MEDGVLWVGNGSDVVASVVADDTPASRAGIKPGDVLLRIDQKLVQSSFDDVIDVLHASSAGSASNTSSSGQATRELLDIPVAGIPSGTHVALSGLASVGLFTLFVGTGVRLRRPENQATLHFFWLSVAFFGVLTFSFTRPARSARLGLLLGRRRGDAAPAAALRPLRAGLPGPARQLGAERPRRARCCRCSICRRCSSAAQRSRRSSRRSPRRRARRASSTLVERRRARSTWRSASSAGSSS